MARGSAEQLVFPSPVEVPGAETANEWLEAVSDGEYFKAIGKLG